MQIAFKQQSAKRLAGINPPDDVMDGLGEVLGGYFARVFAVT